MLRVLVFVLFLGTGCMANASYTGDEVKEACESYKKKMDRYIRDGYNRIRYDGTLAEQANSKMMFFGMMAAMSAFQCDGITDELK